MAARPEEIYYDAIKGLKETYDKLGVLITNQMSLRTNLLDVANKLTDISNRLDTARNIISEHAPLVGESERALHQLETEISKLTYLRGRLVDLAEAFGLSGVPGNYAYSH